MNDSFEQETIAKIRSISSRVNEYFDNQEYKRFTDEYQQEELTDRYLLHVALEVLFSEVKDFGIEADLNIDDFLESSDQLKTLLAIRVKFDSDNLYQFLKNLSEKSFSEFRNIYESVELAEDLYLELAPWLASVAYDDEQWFLIEQSINHWYSTQEFAEYMSSIMYRLLEKTDLNKAVVTDANIESVKRFVNLMKIRNDTITIYIHELCKMFPDLNKDLLDKYIWNYDIQKLNHDQLPLFAAYNDLKPEEEPSFLKEHHRTVNHHVEYWQDKYDQFKKYRTKMPTYTKEIAVMIVVSLVLDKLTSRQMLNRIKPLADIISKDMYIFTQDLCKVDYTALMMQTGKA